MRWKPLLLLALAACALVVVFNDRSSAQAAAAASSAAAKSDEEAARIRIGFKVAPVPLRLRNADPNLVGLGSYIANTQSFCNDCHTNPPWEDGHDPTSGQEPAKMNAAAYLAGGTHFGPFVSRNITPHEHGLPAGLSFAEFVHTLKTGIDPDNAHPQISPLLQVMPWPYFRNMSQHDLAALYEFLRAIPPLPDAAGTPAQGAAAASSAAANSDEEASRIRIGFQVAPVPLNLHDKNPNLVGLGSYIVNTQAVCNGCHTNPPWEDGHNPTLGQEPAKMNAAAYLAGGNRFAGGLIVSRNITPDENGLPAGLSFAEFVHTLKTGIDPDNVHPQLSPLLQIMPWPYFGTMSRHDLAAIYEYLRAIPPLPSAPGTPP
jgi:hypothetical protein